MMSFVNSAITFVAVRGTRRCYCWFEFCRSSTDLVRCCSVKQDFKSLHPDDQDNLQAVIEKDALTKHVISLPITYLLL